MKLLVCTQIVDKNDPILGFFHGWLIEFAKHFETIEVICLKEGTHNLPTNIRVHSLGKEDGENRMKYIYRFYKNTFSLRGAYDTVFVHMNPHYVVLGGLYWRFSHTPVFFWRNHARMNILTRLAAPFAHRVFHTSPYACTARYKHAAQMPVGIDTDLYTPRESEKHIAKKILMLGRLSPVKKIELFIEAGRHLGSDFELHIYGDAPAVDKEYEKNLKGMAGANVFFHPAITNRESPAVYCAHDVFVNLTPKGSMDKTVLEATACGVPSVVFNESFSGVLPDSFILREVTPEALAQKITEVTQRPYEEIRKQVNASREMIIREHSLKRLGEVLYSHIHHE